MGTPPRCSTLLRATTRAVALLGAVAVPTLAIGPAEAHQVSTEIVTRLAEIDPAVDGLTIEVVQSVTTQLVLRNETPLRVEVLDDDGRPFLRFGDGLVEANFDHPDSFLTSDPFAQAAVPPAATDGVVADDWRVVANGDSWGWFDHRLHPRDVTVPDELAASTEPVTLADWSIPLRVGPEATLVEARGVVEYRPPVGAYRTLLTVTPAAMSATVLEGPAPGVFAERRSAEEVVVLGQLDEPMLRFRDAGVDANVASPTWHHVSRATTSLAEPAEPADATADPRWVTVTNVDRFGWIDPRAGYPSEPPDDTTFATAIGRWTIPVLVGGQRFEISGESRWVPLSDRPASSSGESSDGSAWPGVVLVVATMLLALAIAILLVRRNVASEELVTVHTGAVPPARPPGSTPSDR